MTGRLAPHLQESSLLLAVGIRLNHAELISKHLYSLSKQPAKISADALTTAVQTRLHDLKSGVVHDNTLADWIGWALLYGVELDYEVLKLNRGIAALEALLQDSKSKMSIEDIAINLVGQNKASVVKMLYREQILGRKEFSALANEAFAPPAPATKSARLCRDL